MFGSDDVGALQQQIGRQTRAQFAKYIAFIELALLGRQFDGNPDQQGQGIELGRSRQFKLGAKRLGLSQQGLHLGQVEARGRADLDAACEYAKGLLMAGDGLARPYMRILEDLFDF